MGNMYEIARVGWEGETPIPLILMDKRIRDILGLQVKDIVVVKNATNTATAIVEVQFRDLVGSGKVTVSSKLSSAIDCLDGERLEIVGKATEEQATEFQQQAGMNMRNLFSQFINNHGSDEEP